MRAYVDLTEREGFSQVRKTRQDKASGRGGLTSTITMGYLDRQFRAGGGVASFLSIGCSCTEVVRVGGWFVRSGVVFARVFFIGASRLTRGK